MDTGDIHNNCKNCELVMPFNNELFTGSPFTPSNTTSVHS